MKKTFLTFVAVAFGMGVAFAQTTPQVEKQDAAKTELTIDRMSNKTEEASRRAMKVEELPTAVQTNLKGDEFKTFKVVSITEVKPQAGAQPAVVQYEIAFVDNAAPAATEPTLVVLFDEKGKVTSRQEGTAEEDKK